MKLLIAIVAASAVVTAPVMAQQTKTPGHHMAQHKGAAAASGHKAHKKGAVTGTTGVSRPAPREAPGPNSPSSYY